jgi:hypothetical protein
VQHNHTWAYIRRDDPCSSPRRKKNTWGMGTHPERYVCRRRTHVRPSQIPELGRMSPRSSACYPLPSWGRVARPRRRRRLCQLERSLLPRPIRRALGSTDRVTRLAATGNADARAIQSSGNVAVSAESVSPCQHLLLGVRFHHRA